MLAVFLKTLPFFLIIGLGWAAGRRRFFTEEATAYLTRFVFYFALSAMLFRFSANLSLAEVFDARLVGAYLVATTAIYVLATVVARMRGVPTAEAAFEAQCAVIGNIGFLGLPMLGVIMGERAIIGIMQMLAVDLIVFSSLIVIVLTASREGRIGLATVGRVGVGLTQNPMIVAIVAGLLWSGLGLPIPAPMEEFLTILGAAATPCALFAIGASLASKAAVRVEVAAWISVLKLVVHPAAVGLAAFAFGVEPKMAAVMIASASLPVAGNVYILAAHYGVAPQRVSASILISTAVLGAYRLACARPRADVVIWVDADACPVKAEVETVATRLRVPVRMVSNGGIRPSANPLVEMIYVAAGPDEADKRIAEQATRGDVVITGDIPLAAKCVAAGARVLKHDGDPLTPANIGQVLATRDLMADLRAADPFRQGGGRAFTKADRSRFLNALDRAVRAAQKEAPGGDDDG